MSDRAEGLRPCRFVLDVGAQDGGSSLPYARVGRSVVALDLESAGLKRGREKGNIRAGRAVVADGQRLPFSDGAFDLVSSCWFLHELPQQVPFLAEMGRVVRDSGHVLAVDFAAPSAVSQAFLNRYILPDEHARTCGELTEPWADSGLVIEIIEWRARRGEGNSRIRQAVCGPDGHVPQEVKDELHITCDDKRVFLAVPIALVVARKTASPQTPPGPRPNNEPDQGGFHVSCPARSVRRGAKDSDGRGTVLLWSGEQTREGTSTRDVLAPSRRKIVRHVSGDGLPAAGGAARPDGRHVGALRLPAFGGRGPRASAWSAITP